MTCDMCATKDKEIAALRALLKAAPPMRSIGDPRYQVWKKRVDDQAE